MEARKAKRAARPSASLGLSFLACRAECGSVVPKLGCVSFSSREIFQILTPSCTSDGINLGLWGWDLAWEVFKTPPGDDRILGFANQNALSPPSEESLGNKVEVRMAESFDPYMCIFWSTSCVQNCY